MMKRRKISTGALVAALIATTVVACGGSSPPAESATTEEPTSEPSEAAPAEGTPTKFVDMSAPDKMKHMKEVIAPEMAKVFQAADAEEYKDFSCVNCHGPGAKEGNFTMPSDAIPALDKEEMDEHPEVTKFMMEQVVPKMAELMGEQPYNMETHEGFGCYRCHMKKE